VENIESLKKQIQNLTSQLEQRDTDLKIYRKELINANQHIEELIRKSESQLSLARRLQKFLVTTEFPNLPGFELSSKFKSSINPGGDYFDVFSHQDKMKFGTFLSSSSGYGMSSLFLSVLMKLTFEIEHRETQDPQSVLRDILNEINGSGMTEESASIFYGIFDRRKYQFQYSNYGQGVCFFYEAMEQKIHLLKGVEQAISPGEESFDPPEPTTIDLAPRDKVILCSNGFAKIQNSENQYLGFDTLVSTIKKYADAEVHQLRNEILMTAEQHCTKPTADLTVLVVEVKDRVIKLA